MTRLNCSLDENLFVRKYPASTRRSDVLADVTMALGFFPGRTGQVTKPFSKWQGYQRNCIFLGVLPQVFPGSES